MPSGPLAKKCAASAFVLPRGSNPAFSSVNSARCNDSVGLVGVRNLIYLHASINTREVGILVGEIRCSAGNLLSFWVTACLKKEKKKKRRMKVTKSLSTLATKFRINWHSAGSRHMYSIVLSQCGVAKPPSLALYTPGGKKHFSKQFIGWTRPGNVQHHIQASPIKWDATTAWI